MSAVEKFNSGAVNARLPSSTTCTLSRKGVRFERVIGILTRSEELPRSNWGYRAGCRAGVVQGVVTVKPVELKQVAPVVSDPPHTPHRSGLARPPHSPVQSGIVEQQIVDPYLFSAGIALPWHVPMQSC
eukprot:CAMPEP_0173176382 /NCGR_PEP_ID=MMETSP1141-20130122/4414_1 /TAXON_ID=483371 /ORGANISM="non described non described, Strain CCMP2298" /LENGTH=128 /DNA_ID=CAMNT_0014098685 /DNA_START=184 /DNA_END=570 /DNA_ORIENTATION=+